MGDSVRAISWSADYAGSQGTTDTGGINSTAGDATISNCLDDCTSWKGCTRGINDSMRQPSSYSEGLASFHSPSSSTPPPKSSSP